MAVEILENWVDQPSRLEWSRWTGIEEYYLDQIEFERDVLSELAPKHPVFEPGYQFKDWIHFVPSDGISRIRSSQSFESEYQEIIREIFENIEQDANGGLIPLVAQWDDDYSQTATYEEKRQAIETFLCRVFTLQMRGDVNFEKVVNSNTETPDEPSIEPPERQISVSVERYVDLDHKDIIQFNIENPAEFFRQTFGDNTLMYDRLLKSSKEPESVEESVQLDSVPPAQWRIHTGISYSN